MLKGLPQKKRTFRLNRILSNVAVKNKILKWLSLLDKA